MGGFCGAISNRDVVLDVYFGTDYHSHLGTRRGGMAAWDPELGFQREIHNIENAPFRTKFEQDGGGDAAASAASAASATPIPSPCWCARFTWDLRHLHGGRDQQRGSASSSRCWGDADRHFDGHERRASVNSNELVAALISQQRHHRRGHPLRPERGGGHRLRLNYDARCPHRRAGTSWAACPSSSARTTRAAACPLRSFAYQKLGYHGRLRAGSRARSSKITTDGWETLLTAEKEMRICAFLWTYYGYPNSNYEGINVEVMRNRNGASLARTDKAEGVAQDIDFVSGVPDSGTPHAIGYSNESGIPFARPFIKYTPTWPRSFMPTNQKERDRVAKMKQIPVHELIEGKKLLFVDDSIVRGTQLRETVEFLYANGAKEVHIRSACPPIMYGCKFLNFSTSRSPMELIARRTVYDLEGEEGEKHLDEYSDPNTERGQKLREAICQQLHFTSLEYQSLDGLIEAIGLEPCKVCTYCWNGKE